MKNIFFCCCYCITLTCAGQTMRDKLTKAMAQLEADSQFRHALVAMTVRNSTSNALVYAHNAAIGVAPASTQKLFTSVAAFELLGGSFQYSTTFSYQYLPDSLQEAVLLVQPSGDPSFGSSRFAGTQPEKIIAAIAHSAQQSPIKPKAVKTVVLPLFTDDLPGGWVWDDIGNYYGAGAFSCNWRENQYDLLLSSGKQVGDTALVAATVPVTMQQPLESHLQSAAEGTGDNTIVYLPYGAHTASIVGTIPVNEKAFAVSASITDPYNAFARELAAAMQLPVQASSVLLQAPVADNRRRTTTLFTHVSPSFDSLNYWFLRKSINLYGEAFLKTMALRQKGIGSTSTGVTLLKEFWKTRGIEPAALHLYDGSGLSPQNRVTTDALVSVLQYARARSWYNSFYLALPTYNGMKIKSGSINGVRSFAGYHTAKDGVQYSFAIVVNNFDGSAAAAVKKIFLLLDNLK
ncbi:MAG TPA: D-alanyl-D-alanine carboxypeptidase/D-alanyl-D-alanine-endopeptidase [Chitinophagaceae bacterium]|nr:D-alanyl-D-alanine carboxypeptidase/D-alanyl-D-alanine-endopeptidase [Chitinophagaceae bacterium]